ncbi:shikimate kinase [Paenibacillus sp. IB182496]|uniref:Shikimate kinase n=1 Tax=Paenibacillus sabuli TaxID=2772509 RepID=A0A927GS64_9BACL|nr:shikimate kinase [Paenibacillus sabuli]MBD2846228.1 shikimate kinase [Paenibacillus sabuli]
MPAEKHAIVLIGFMGTGKSVVSHHLSRRLNCAAVDLDEEIERHAGRRIRDIFAEAGEEAFRKLETETLEHVLKRPGLQVLATGGGAVLRPQNCRLMQQYGWVVALKAAPWQIIHRVSGDANRPLLQGDVKGRVYKLLRQRKHAYDFADITIDTGSLRPEEVANVIVRKWNACS